QFSALERIGMLKREASRVLSVELLVVFFLPIAVGIVHSGVALTQLANLLGFADSIQSIAPAFGVVCLLYVVCFAVYFLFARISYLKRVSRRIATG
ncbi:MAG TPA: hypothetical protein VFN35_29695, partial [Ktedonobacteraceae bacterium]|nr:hypothetical protein [Ktedonobacteraceae bacterium]